MRAPSAADRKSLRQIILFASILLFFIMMTVLQGGTRAIAIDPGVRAGNPGAGAPIAGLTTNQLAFFTTGQDDFMQVQSVLGSIPGTGSGLGPTFNGESCAQCHAQPSTGGTSPFTNPQIGAASAEGATNQVPFFITPNGPVREARFPLTPDLRQRDGGVHDLFTIAGRSDAAGCNLAQPDFLQAAKNGNLIFRIPTPVFGAGLIELIPDSTIRSNLSSKSARKRNLGISGRPNTNGNDGTITRFGWKAQNKSLEIFSGEAYNVEMGVTNELFQSERDQSVGCQFNGTPEDLTHFDQDGPEIPSDVTKFAIFMRFLDQSQPAPATTSTQRGLQIFHSIGCALCHTPSLTTGQSSVAALSNIQANLFSDLVLHHMGPSLADNVSQGAAGGDEFRTAPLWGLGQRIFFMHDGRTSDLVKAILSHSSTRNTRYPGSEANAVIDNYWRLSVQDQQDLLNFLRSL
ncbi:MAG: hypothetical protein AUI85_12090 [Acidobacteriales bacterium 13_1_40CM_3_55_5]|nr:MAG: hypothetical protein AUI85_12090 [Acidobacteriales bacterium 13_1_40CM_3_55_5]